MMAITAVAGAERPDFYACMRICENKSTCICDFFREAVEPTRMRILNLLRQQALCVAELQEVLGLPEPLVSRHLARLRNAHLVEVERDGKRRIYRLVEPDAPLAIVLRRFLADVAGSVPDFNRDSAHLAHLFAPNNSRHS